MNTDKIREALELAEAMADIFDQLSQKLGDLRERNMDRSRLEEIRDAIAELDRMEAPKVLTTEALWQAFKNELVPDGCSESIGLMFDQPTAEFVLRYVRDNGYLAPAPGLTVEEVMEAFTQECRPPEIRASVMRPRFRARLTAAIEAKSRTA